LENREVYIADDDKNLLELYSSIFKGDELDELKFFEDENENSISIKMFEDGYYLLEAFKERYKNGDKVPIVILDMRMPKMDGFETAKRVREIDPNCIIVIITAYSDTPIRAIREELKKDTYYFKKPFNEDEIYSLIYSLLKQWNNREENELLHREIQNVNRELEAEVKELKMYLERIKKIERGS
jgi:DNA-binding NtrC family response regulator